MTKPQVIIPGQTIFTTIKTTDGRFFLTPDRDGYQAQLTGYLLGCALRHSFQAVHAFCAMSNHVHYIYTDLFASRPQFRNFFHGEMAKKHNILLQRRGYFWQKPCHEWIMDKAAMKIQLLYTWGNVLEANLVERVQDWKGFVILPKHWGKVMTIERPCGMPTHDPELWPESVSFTPMPPAYYQDQPLDDVIAYFEEAITAMEQDYQRNRKTPVLGMDACFDVNPFLAPDSDDVARRQEQVLTEPKTLMGKRPLERSEPKPVFSIAPMGPEDNFADRQLKIQERFSLFWVDYQNARLAFREDKSTIMPFGTYQRCYVDQCECLEPVPGDVFLPCFHENDFLTWFWSPSNAQYWPGRLHEPPAN